MNNPSLSIIIINYNNSRYLPDCLDSLLGQTLAPTEIIVVDDNSTDESRSILTSYLTKCPAIRLILLNKNDGARNARNVGYKESRCDYVMFLDSDDYLLGPNVIELLMKNCGEYACSFGHYIRVSDKKKPLFKYKGRPLTFSKKQHSLPYLLSEFDMRTFPRNYVVPKSMVNIVGLFDFPYDFNEDFAFLLKLINGGAVFKNIDCYAAAYRETGNGLSRKNKFLLAKTRSLLRKQYFNNFTFCDKTIYIFFISLTPIKKVLVSLYHLKKRWLIHKKH